MEGRQLAGLRLPGCLAGDKGVLLLPVPLVTRRIDEAAYTQLCGSPYEVGNEHGIQDVLYQIIGKEDI